MTSESAGPMPADEQRPSWQWLQERIDTKRDKNAGESTELGQWFDAELLCLEEELAGWITPRSKFRDDRRASGE